MVCGAGNYGGLSYVPKLETLVLCTRRLKIKNQISKIQMKNKKFFVHLLDFRFNF